MSKIWQHIHTYAESSPQAQTMTDKKLGWFQRWFFRQYQQAYELQKNQDQAELNWARRGPSTPGVVSLGNRVLNDRNSIDMSLYTADGGWIVQFTDYDQKNDRTNVCHYVIPESVDFGPRLAEIITLQCMKR
jgi:hypothetical protein